MKTDRIHFKQKLAENYLQAGLSEQFICKALDFSPYEVAQLKRNKAMNIYCSGIS